MDNLFKYIKESILDVDALDAATDKMMADTWAKENLKGDYSIRRLKNGMFKVRGKVILRNYNGTDFGGIVIDSLDGSLYVEDCPNIKSLDGLFARQSWGDVKTKVTGDIKIANCKSFNSLEGLPRYIDGEFVVMDCPSLKSLEGAPEMTCDVTVVKCGKKFTKAQIQKHFKCAMRIMCSMEERDEMITEAMSEPHLLKFWEWVKETYPKLKKEREEEGSRNKTPEKILLSKIADGAIRLDKIRPSDVEVYDNYENKIKDIRKALLRVANGGGIAIIKNMIADPEHRDGVYEYIFSGNGYEASGYNLYDWVRYNKYNSRITCSMGKMELCDLAGTAAGKPNSTWRQFIIVNLDIDLQGNRYKLKDERRKAKEGIVHNTKEYYEQVARANRKRWKEIIATARANKLNDEYMSVLSAVEALMHRYAKLATKMRNPDFIEQNRWSSTIDACNELVKSINNTSFSMMKYVTTAQGGRGIDSKESALKYAQQYKKTLAEKIVTFDKKLTELGL